MDKVKKDNESIFKSKKEKLDNLFKNLVNLINNSKINQNKLQKSNIINNSLLIVI